MSSPKPHIIFSTFLGFLNLCLLVLIGWASYRGFELSDESFYYLGYLYYQNIPDLSASSFHIIYGRLFSFLELSLPGVRLLRLTLTVLGSCVLYFGVQRHTNQGAWWERLFLFNIIVAGMLLGYAWAPMALSYNSMSSILMALIVGLWLFGLSTFFWRAMACWLVLGGLFLLLFFIKATNLLLLPIIVLATIYWYASQGTQRIRILNLGIRCALAFSLGALGMLVFVSGGIVSVQETLNSYLQQLFGLTNADSTHSMSYLWNKYYKNADMVVQKLKLPVFGLVLLYALIKAYTRIGKGQNTSRLVLSFKIIGILGFLVFIIQNEYWKGGTPLKYKMLIPYIFAVVLAFLNRSLETKNLNYWVLFGLFGIPIAGAIGTNNGLSAQVLFYSVYIFLMLYYLLTPSSPNFFKQIIIGIVMLLVSLQVFSGLVSRPYRVAPLALNTMTLKATPNLKNLKVDRSIHDLFENLRPLKSVKAEYVFTYSGMLGVNALMDKKPYSLEWFNEGDDGKICALIQKSEITPENILFLIPEELPLTTTILSCLQERGIHFKTDYTIIKSFEFFYPRRNKNMTFHVYEFTSN